MPISIKDPDTDSKIRDLAALTELIAEHGTGIFTRSPLLYGVLTGRFNAETVFPENDHRHRRWYRDAWKRRIEEVESLSSLVMSLAQRLFAL